MIHEQKGIVILTSIELIQVVLKDVKKEKEAKSQLSPRKFYTLSVLYFIPYLHAI